LPALAKAKEKAKAIKCVNNLKQLGIAMMIYEDENKCYPAAIDTDPGAGSLNNAWIWPALLRSTMGKSPSTDIFKCPDAPDAAQWVPSFGSLNPPTYGYLYNENPLIPGGSSFMSYGYNCWGSQYIWQGAIFGLGGYTTGSSKTKSTSVVKPAECIALGDSNWKTDSGGDPNWSGFIGMYATGRQWPLDLHSSRANILFCDGHVQPLKRTVFVSQLNPPFNSMINPPEPNQLWNIDHQVHQ
jgi:prepilin-type processing-associated H-X9-DG protein